MDIRVQTKISVLLEKINYLQLGIQQTGMTSKVDKDLLTNYVRELYELVLSLPVQTPQPEAPYYPPPPTMYPNGVLPVTPPSYSPQVTNGYYQQAPPPVNGNGTPAPSTNGTPLPAEPARSQTATAMSFGNGKRTLNESIRIKTAETERPHLSEQFKKDEHDVAAKMQLTPIKDLKTFIGLNKRFSYINFLFGNDANLYDEAIEKLNNSANLHTATDYMDNHLAPRLKWSGENEMVKELYALVERRYMNG